MNRREFRKRRNTQTRTYPIYTVSDSDSTDGSENFIEIVPVQRRRPIEIKYFKSKIDPAKRKTKRIQRLKPLPMDYHRQPTFQRSPREKHRVANVQTDPIAQVNSLPISTKDEISTKPQSQYFCLRVITFILAAFLLVISLLLFIFSINILANPNMTKIRAVALVYASATPSSGFSGSGPTDTILITGIISMIMSVFMLLVSILSLVGLFWIRVRFYLVFFVFGPALQIILLAILIGFSIFILITGDTELQRLAYTTRINVLYFYNSTSLIKDGWDFVQYYFDCCGVKWNNTDWIAAPSTGWKFSSTLPLSCCGSDSNDIGHAGRIFLASDLPSLTGFCYYGDIGKKTCFDQIRTNLLITVLVFLAGVALIVLALTILSIFLLCVYRRLHQQSNENILSEASH